ncbi:XdhC family protein [Streptomyces sp. NPDC059862]|uniref:XdhC family protein n=1 Tax=Streptomyces sp. NPDC059862 TaxID=3346975 RepID=UPI003645FD31
MDSDGTAVGSVSGGCVEGAVYDLCAGRPSRTAGASSSGSATATKTPSPSG